MKFLIVNARRDKCVFEYSNKEALIKHLKESYDSYKPTYVKFTKLRGQLSKMKDRIVYLYDKPNSDDEIEKLINEYSVIDEEFQKTLPHLSIISDINESMNIYWTWTFATGFPKVYSMDCIEDLREFALSQIGK